MSHRLFAFGLIAALAACGGNNDTTSSSSTNSVEPSSSVASSSSISSSSSQAPSSSSSSVISSSSSSSSSVAVGGGECDNGAVFCESFEQEALGAGVPSDIDFEDCGSGDKKPQYEVVSENGGKALKIVNNDSSNCFGSIIVPQTNTLSSAYVKFDAKVSTPRDSYSVRWFLLLENTDKRKSEWEPNGTRLRISEQQNATKDYMAWNRDAAGDTVAPDVYSGGDHLASTSKLQFNSWACYELYYNEATDLITFSINGVEQAGLRLDNDSSTGFDQRWLGGHGGSYPVALDAVRLGFGRAPGEVFVDNIIVSEQPIGCN